MSRTLDLLRDGEDVLKGPTQGAPVSSADLRSVLAESNVPGPAIPALPEAAPDVGRDVTLKPSSFGRMSFRGSWEDGAGGMRDTALEGYRHLQEAIPFVRETFASLYDANGCRDLPEKDSTDLGRSMRRALEGAPEWEPLRASSAVHSDIAAQATSRLSDAVFKALGLDGVPEDDNELKSDPRELLEIHDALEQLHNEMNDGDPADPLHLPPNQTKAFARAIAKSEGARVAMAAGLAKATASGAIARAVAVIAKDARAQAEGAAILRGMGFSVAGKGSSGQEDVPAEYLREVIKNPALLRILQRAGRVLEVHAGGGVSPVSTGRCDVVGVEPSGDLARTTTAFRTRLTSDFGDIALIELLDGGAQSLMQRGEERVRRGPMFLLVDRSGSMEGTNARMARGFAVCALAICKRERRVCIVVSFAGDGDTTGAVYSPARPGSMGAAIAAATIGAGGGTDVVSAMRAAAELTRAQGLAGRCADGTIVTDGAFDPLTEEVRRMLLPKGARFFMVGVDVAATDGAAAHPYFDEVVHFSTRTSEDDQVHQASGALSNLFGRKAP